VVDVVGAGADYRFFLSDRCVSAEPATLFAAFDVLGFDNCFEAFEPTGFDVCSFFPMRDLFS
jgi:hypothetical protein